MTSLGGLAAELVAKNNVSLILLDIDDLPRPTRSARLRASLGFPRAVIRAVRILARVDATVVLGVGGVTSAVGVIAAGLLGIPAVLQEQNSHPGRLNRALAPMTDLVCCGFTETLKVFPSLPARWTGNPVADEFFMVGDLHAHACPRLLVRGPREGSLFLNRTIPQAIRLLQEVDFPIKVQHQAGVRWADVVRTSYSDVKVAAEVSATLTQPWEALAEADLVIARAGALAVAEIAATGRGAVLIPWAGAADNHQEQNARSVQAAGGALVITEIEASPQRLAKVLEDLFSNKEQLEQMGRCSRTMARTGAARGIASHLLSLGGAS